MWERENGAFYETVKSDDVVIIIAASFLAALIRFGKDAGVIYLQEHLFVFLLSGVIFLVFFYIADLYDFKKDFRSSKQMWKIILSGILALIVSKVSLL